MQLELKQFDVCELLLSLFYMQAENLSWDIASNTCSVAVAELQIPGDQSTNVRLLCSSRLNFITALLIFVYVILLIYRSYPNCVLAN